MKRIEAPAYTVTIYIAGDRAAAEQICREHCFKVGLCVSVFDAAYIYTGGQESGIAVQLINYPRFPLSAADLFERAEALTGILIEGLYQTSASIDAPDKTVWLSRRSENV